MNRNLSSIIILVLFYTSTALSQAIYQSTSHEVYSFLKRMEAKQLLSNYKDAAKPLSRMTLAKSLKALENKAEMMTRVERETYEFLKTEFRYELLKLAGDNEPTEVRWHLYSTELTKGILNFDINYRLGRVFIDGEQKNLRAQGIQFYGYAFNDVGFYFKWTDHRETGENINYQRLYTPEPGVIPNVTDNGKKRLEYNESNVQFTWQTGSFALSLEKNNNIWGYGKNGNVIFSNKAPSYPQIKMRVPLSEDIDFIYFHGELNSNIMDSSRSYWVHYFNPSFSSFRAVNHSKYIAAHQLEISLFDGVDLSIGESVVYSDRGPVLVYLIPIMFFKAAEWYNRDKDNTQLFGSIDLNIIKNLNAYFSVFIDELNTDELFDSDKSRRQIAFSTGFQLFDLPITNTDVTFEYSRANPSVYNHKYPGVTFMNDNYDLGHWIGQNADDLFFEVGFTPYHSLRLTAFSEIYRKGADTDIYSQYQPDGGGLGFLHDLLRIERSFGISGRYQPLRDVFFDFRIRTRKIEDYIYPNLSQNRQIELYLAASLGIL